MTKEQQTEEVLLRLRDLTILFTRSYQPKYYYQYRGDIYDLAMDYYCQFLTPKARKDKPKQSLLDKYNSEITSLEYLTKVAVIRKLIDSSKADPIQKVSIDELVSEYGDLITKSFDLVETSEEIDFDSAYFRKRISDAFSKLQSDEKNKIFSQLYQSGSDLCKFLYPDLKFINNCPVQQITDKTIVLFVPNAHKCVNFSVQSGEPKGSYRPFVISDPDRPQYQSGFSRELFEEYCNSVTAV